MRARALQSRALVRRMACHHTGFHSCAGRYDRARALIVYVRLCDRCGQTLGEVARVPYEPRYQPSPPGGTTNGRALVEERSHRVDELLVAPVLGPL